MLENADFAKFVAELFASGMGRESMLAELQEAGYDVRDKDTITRWRRDPRIKALVQKIIEDRTLQISRKIDAIIEGRLSQAKDLPIKDLIAIRKEYGGSAVVRKEVADDNITADALKTMEERPEFANELEAFLRGDLKPSEEPEPSDVDVR